MSAAKRATRCECVENAKMVQPGETCSFPEGGAKPPIYNPKNQSLSTEKLCKNENKFRINNQVLCRRYFLCYTTVHNFTNGKNYFIEVRNGKPQRRKRRKARIGCIEAEIAKTLSFIVDEKPVIVVMASDGRVNSSSPGKFLKGPLKTAPDLAII